MFLQLFNTNFYFVRSLFTARNEKFATIQWQTIIIFIFILLLSLLQLETENLRLRESSLKYN